MQQASRPLHLPANPRELPTGFVTFLFSDIEGSTVRWEMYPEAMHGALARHDVLLQDCICAWNGVVFKTVGDAFCAAFHDPADAIGAAIAAQHAVIAEDWSAVGGLRVRMAVHSGTPNLRDGDYFGTPVNHVARLLGAAHAGQILVSAGTALALPQTLPNGVELRDLGRHRLRDFPEMESIHQVVAPDLPDIFPPLRTIAERPSNLPQQLPALLGREEDAQEIADLLARHRAVSILGAGGVGKTSLALAVATDLLPTYEDGAWLIELAPLSDAASVIPAIASELHVTGTANGSALDAILAYLKHKHLLLVIDNCEHVITAASQVVDAIMRACANVRVLVTSREPLGIGPERRYRLPSLSVPPEGAISAQEALRYAAPALFQERARAHVPSFEITDRNARVVADICRRLDGIALAIELAAPRLRMLSLQQLSDKLSERFRILTGGLRTALPRQQTMRALIEWSYDLLSEAERTLLRRASVFAGGWTLGAAMDVCAGESLEAWEILDHLTTLVDKSLVVTETQDDEARYRMLESTRQYALERLTESGEREAFVRAHAAYYVALARRADDAWGSMNAKAWIVPLDADLDNFRAVLSWAIGLHADDRLGIGLIGSLEAYWWDAQPIEGRRWVAQAQPLIETAAESREAARFRLAAANVALTLRQQKAALENAQRALESYRSIGDSLGTAAALRCRGAALINLGRVDEGEADVAQALETFRQQQHPRLTALALRSLGLAPRLRGELDRAAPIYREALAYAQRLDDERGIQIIAGNLAEVEFDAGNCEQALEHGREALSIARARRDRITTCGLLINICAYLVALERYDEARSLAREALEMSQELQSELHFGIAVQHLAAVAAVNGDCARALRLLGYSDAVYRLVESTREPTEQKEYDWVCALLRARVCAADYAQLLQEGAAFTQDQTLAEALVV